MSIYLMERVRAHAKLDQWTAHTAFMLFSHAASHCRVSSVVRAHFAVHVI